MAPACSEHMFANALPHRKLITPVKLSQAGETLGP